MKGHMRQCEEAGGEVCHDHLTLSRLVSYNKLYRRTPEKLRQDGHHQRRVCQRFPWVVFAAPGGYVLQHVYVTAKTAAVADRYTRRAISPGVCARTHQAGSYRMVDDVGNDEGYTKNTNI